MNLFGFNVKVIFLLYGGKILAYSWHFTREKAIEHMHKIMDFHSLDGEIKSSEKLENWLEKKLNLAVVKGEKFKLPNVSYRNRRVYEEILKIPRGETETYPDVARKSGVKFSEMLVTLMRNPFQVLIPCHRLLTKRGTLMGFYPLGRNVKRKLLEIEGVRIGL